MAKDSKIQVVITKEENEKIVKEAEKQQRTVSNLARKYIKEGLTKDDVKP